jgi:hypothetical protein
MSGNSRRNEEGKILSPIEVMKKIVERDNGRDVKE